MIINELLSLTIRSLVDWKKIKKLIAKKYIPTYTHSVILKFSFVYLK